MFTDGIIKKPFPFQSKFVYLLAKFALISLHSHEFHEKCSFRRASQIINYATTRLALN